MSKQLTLSATLSVLAMAAMAAVMSFGEPAGDRSKGAAAHGSVLSVLLRL